MCGSRTGASSQILKENPKALFVHCFGHVLNLAGNDMVRNIRFLKDIFDTTHDRGEISNLIKISPKRDQMLDKIRNDLSVSCPGFRILCLTMWTVRAESLKSVLDTWIRLESLWEKSQNLDPEMRKRSIGFKKLMETFNYFYDVNVLQLLLRHSYELSTTLQSPPMTVCQEKNSVGLTVKTWQSLRSYVGFSSLRNKILQVH